MYVMVMCCCCFCVLICMVRSGVDTRTQVVVAISQSGHSVGIKYDIKAIWSDLTSPKPKRERERKRERECQLRFS